MPSPIIEVNGLSKRYQLGQFGMSSFREESEKWLRRFRGKPAPAQAAGGEFWALSGVSFSVNPGEVVGIIGRNGAGKSTLLKLLSRITEPTAGEIVLRGRVASLLEVGTGFHPELSGRDNIFLNGAILGMKRAEIAAKFDEIVEFAEVGKFIDTPVKRYSSGMYVKLAFAVAAHLEPDILIVDEVLAVGDAAFQKKCVRKMGEVAHLGRTVLFVSHNFGLVQSLCNRGIYLHEGRVAFDGPAHEAIKHCRSSYESTTPLNKKKTGLLRDISLIDSNGRQNDFFHPGLPMTFRIETAPSAEPVQVIMRVIDPNQTLITSFDSANPGTRDQDTRASHIRHCIVDELLIAPGTYQLDVELWAGGTRSEVLEAALRFEVGEGELDGRFVRAIRATGVVPLRHSWTIPPDRTV